MGIHVEGAVFVDGAPAPDGNFLRAYVGTTECGTAATRAGAYEMVIARAPHTGTGKYAGCVPGELIRFVLGPRRNGQLLTADDTLALPLSPRSFDDILQLDLHFNR